MKSRILLGLLMAVTATLNMFAPARAAGFEYSFTHEVTIADNLATTVETTIRAKAGANASVPGTISVPLFGVSPTNLIARDSNDNEIAATAEGNALALRLNALQAAGAKDWTIRLSYTSTSGLSIGQSTVFMIAPFDYGEVAVANEEVTLVSGAEVGTFVTRGLKPTESSSSAGNFINTWRSSEGALKTAFGLLFGDNAVADVTFAKTLENDTYWWQTQSIVLPPDTNQQQVFINDISPQPRSIHLDEDGNVIVEYRLSPRQSLDVSANLQVVTNSYTYSLESSLLTNDIDPLLTERYTSLNDTWIDTSLAFDDAVATPVVDLAREIYEKVSEEYAAPQGDSAYAAALSRANTLVGEMRANKIPARLVVGAVFGDGARVFASPQPSAWTEVYIPAVGWMTLDPNFEQSASYFGVADVQRMALALRGFDPEYPPENSTSFSITFVDSEPPSTPVTKPEIKATKHMLLPGLTIDTIAVKMPPGVIVDNAGLLIGDDEQVKLGSLAPLQTLNIRSASMLAAAFTSESVQYGVFSGDQLADSDILAQTTMNVSYLPMIVLVLLSLLGFVSVKYLWPRIQARRGRDKSDKESRNKLTISADAEGEDIENVDMLEALDIPQDETPVATEPEPMSAQQEVKHPVANPPGAPAAQPITEEAPRAVHTTPPKHIPLERAHEATPEEIRREIQRKRPRRLIQ